MLNEVKHLLQQNMNEILRYAQNDKKLNEHGKSKPEQSKSIEH